jgi:beta-galactosidase
LNTGTDIFDAQTGVSEVINSDKVHGIMYGGDYNPEQWNDDVIKKDMELLPAAGINIVTLNVFNWAMIQPDENTYDFSSLDRTVEMVTGKGMDICMATSTGAHPAWMAHRHPDILRTEFSGMRRKYGARHNSCPNSPTFRVYSVRLAGKLAEHYKDQQNIVAWHVNNEFGGICYCENCVKAFREWLKRKYVTIEALNEAWDTHFWGHTFYEWDEIEAPTLLTEHFEEKRSMFPCITLDYYRFNSDSMLRNYIEEAAEIKRFIPDARITTNLMGFHKGIDYQKWARNMDFISWDNYPSLGDPEARTAMTHDLMRGLKPGMPFALMEQTPSVTNWHEYSSLKRPGEMRLISYQAVAHGADTVMFFQMRQSRAECEKLHGAVISHVGTDQTRVYRECAELGKELRELGSEILGSTVHSEAAVLFDWNNWWAIEMTAGLNMDIRYTDEAYCYYEALHSYGIQTDLVGTDADISGYKIVIVPEMYMAKPGVAQKLEEYALAGGTVVFSIYTGIADENDSVTQNGYPGDFRRMCGIWTEEFDSLSADEQNYFMWNGQAYTSELVFALSHPEGARVLASYEEDFYRGMPVITENDIGRGRVYYIGTRSERAFYHAFIRGISVEQGILDASADELPDGIEICTREKDGSKYIFILNHRGEKEHRGLNADIRLTEKTAGTGMLSGKKYDPGDMLELPAYGVEIIRQQGE